MKTPGCLLLTLALSTSVDPLIRPAFAQNESIIVEAESGAAGSQFSLLTDSATGAQYVSLNAAGLQLVKNWAAGTVANNGVILVAASGVTDGVDWSSREGANVPQLLLSYTTP